MWRVAIYAREAPGRAGQARLDRQVASLAAQVVRQPGWCHVATYADQGAGTVRPGLSRMLADAASYFDLVAVNSYGRLSPDHRELQAVVHWTVLSARACSRESFGFQSRALS